MIPITRLSVGEEEANAASEAISSGWLTQGKRVEEFEKLVAGYVGAKHAVATNSCTTALHLALIAAGVKAEDEVICPSFSFVATGNAILYAGAKPVFVDIDPRTYNIDASLVEAAITPRTVAILPADQIGLAADLPALIDIAKKHNLKLIEDAAPALGAMVGEGRVGNLGDFTCFSFDARKILTTGEGGMVTTNDGDAAERMRSLRAHAASVPTIVRHTATSVVLERYPELGYNYKLTDIQAAIGIVQMSRIDAIVNERRRLAHRYNGLLKANNHLVTPIEPAGYRHVYQSYCVRLKSQKSQVDVMTALAAQGIATRRITAMHLEPFYRRLFPDLSLPESERACSESLLLPLFVGLTDREQEEVVNALVGAVD